MHVTPCRLPDLDLSWEGAKQVVRAEAILRKMGPTTSNQFADALAALPALGEQEALQAATVLQNPFSERLASSSSMSPQFQLRARSAMDELDEYVQTTLGEFRRRELCLPC